MDEIWKDIIGYEGLYMISNHGRVKSLNYNRTEKEKILKPGKTNTEHLFVYLSKNGVKKYYYVHQLVAIHFIPNTEGKSDVHHKDHNPLNNNVDNLVWLTRKEHASEHPEWGKPSAKKCSRHINQYTKDGLFLRAWYSAREIQREIGYNHSAILKCCQGKYKTAYGYIWKYADEN